MKKVIKNKVILLIFFSVMIILIFVKLLSDRKIILPKWEELVSVFSDEDNLSTSETEVLKNGEMPADISDNEIYGEWEDDSGITEMNDEALSYSGDMVKTVLMSDKNAPEIFNVEISYEITSDIDAVVPVTFKVNASDDITPDPMLEYAVAFKEENENEESVDLNWTKDSEFTLELKKNGVWVIYCRDVSGNISTCERELIITDTRAPNIYSVQLDNDDGWQAAKTITVMAEDKCPVSYCFFNVSTEESSGFIDSNVYEVSSAGEWKVQAKDTAGNISEIEIEVTMIDSQSPVINNILVEVD